MSTHGWRALLSALFALTAVIYGLGLGYSPIYMHDAEVLFALHARSIAATLRDTNGTFLPLYFHMPSIGANVWFHPMIVYLSALVLKVLPFSESSVRMSSVVVGLVDVALMYLVAHRLFRDRRYALLAAALLALTPAHFIHSRLTMDYLYPVPFVLGWLWCLLRYDETEEPWLMWLGGGLLGAGFYSYIAAVAFMPLYLVFAWLFLLAKYRRPVRAHLTTTAAFIIPLAGFIAWRLLYPDVFSGTAYRYGITRGGVVFGILRLFNYNLIGDYVSNYWNFFNPNFLFLVGSPNFQSSSRAAGVFLIPVALFVAVGLYAVVVTERPRVAALLLAGLLTAPIPAVMVEEPYAIYRELELLVFATLIAVYGVRQLLNTKRSMWRAVAVAALVATPLDFAYFYRDYFTIYRMNAFGVFGGNTKGSVERVLDIDRVKPAPVIYLSARIPYGAERWEFYLRALNRGDVLTRSRPLPVDAPISALPTGSLVVERVEDGDIKDPRFSDARMYRLADVLEPFQNRIVSFAIFERR